MRQALAHTSSIYLVSSEPKSLHGAPILLHNCSSSKPVSPTACPRTPTHETASGWWRWWRDRGAHARLCERFIVLAFMHSSRAVPLSLSSLLAITDQKVRR